MYQIVAKIVEGEKVCGLLLAVNIYANSTLPYEYKYIEISEFTKLVKNNRVMPIMYSNQGSLYLHRAYLEDSYNAISDHITCNGYLEKTDDYFGCLLQLDNSWYSYMKKGKVLLACLRGTMYEKTGLYISLLVIGDLWIFDEVVEEYNCEFKYQDNQVKNAIGYLYINIKDYKKFALKYRCLISLYLLSNPKFMISDSSKAQCLELESVNQELLQKLT